ncbi:MAG: trypsin-like peptidase domain-containing protein [Candidatus Paceibacterota bacterium]|jgi:hypothetical protein
MDIKDLNRSQFLLLLFLIMFVSSITTAIVTVTLMDQSPGAGVTNTINRVIERVVPGATTTIVKIVKEEPSTVSEGEQIVKAMEIVAPSVVRLNKQTDKGLESLGTGFVTRGDIVATALKNLPEGLTTGISITKGSVSVPGEIVKRDTENNIALVRFAATSTFPVDKLLFTKNLPTSGATSIALAYSENGSPEIMMGIIMGVINTTSTSTSETGSGVIRTGAVIGDNIGGPIINTAGEIVGIGISRGYAISASTLQTIVDQIK